MLAAGALHDDASDIWAQYGRNLKEDVDALKLMSDLLAGHGKTLCVERVRAIMQEIEREGPKDVCEHAELHQLWVRDPCDAMELYRRQRAAKLGYGRRDVQDYVNARVVDDSARVVLDRIIKGCGEARQAFDIQAACGMTYTMDAVERLYAETMTRDRIDGQMREFIDRCGGVLSCGGSGRCVVARRKVGGRVGCVLRAM